MNYRTPVSSPTRPILLICGLLLIAANLRAPITGVAPVLETLQITFALSPTQAGLLTTLPLLVFGIISPFAGLLAREYGFERTLFAALILILGGVALRSTGSVACLYLGSTVIGTGIAIGNVLLPGVIKRDFPQRVPAMTGGAALAMGAAAALTSVSAVPVESALGWQAALAAPVVFQLLAVGLWSSQLTKHANASLETATLPQDGRIWCSALAWQVTLFMGVNSLLYYVLVAWLPTILTSDGLSSSIAGSLHGVMQLASAIPGLLLGPIIHRLKDQKLIAAALSLIMSLGLIGFCVAPAWALLWSFCFGLGSGGGLLLALIFVGLKTNSVQQAAALSGMAQCVGYLLAACGPMLAGKLHDFSDSWLIVLYVGVGLTFLMAILGLLAGRPHSIGMHSALPSSTDSSYPKTT